MQVFRFNVHAKTSDDMEAKIPRAIKLLSWAMASYTKQLGFGWLRRMQILFLPQSGNNRVAETTQRGLLYIILLCLEVLRT